MKNTVAMLVISILALHQVVGQGNMNMEGAWKMTRQVANDGKKDTLLKQDQLKIYTDRHMMYASPRATDSFGEYGIATYRVDGDKVVENIFYTSSAGEVTDSALLKVTKQKDGYRQVIDYSDSSGTFLLIEDYAKAGKPVKSPLDGAWKQVRNIYINSKGDTTNKSVVTQFKMYESGHFIWANPIKNPGSNNFVTAYGYGTFRMAGNNRCIETNINSTYHDLVNRPVNIEIEMLGKDSYKQTIKNELGDRSVEIYERLK